MYPWQRLCSVEKCRCQRRMDGACCYASRLVPLTGEHSVCEEKVCPTLGSQSSVAICMLKPRSCCRPISLTSSVVSSRLLPVLSAIAVNLPRQEQEDNHERATLYTNHSWKQPDDLLLQRTRDRRILPDGSAVY